MKSQKKTDVPETFEQFGLKSSILKDVAEEGYRQPTPIQAQCIPPALDGKDVIGLAQTGTGKTAAFGLPIIQRVAGKAEMSALILAPTRELAQQIGEALRTLGKSSGVRVAVIVGGVPVKHDHRALSDWPNILVATPGRLIDHIYSRSIVLDDIEVLTVDEADRMYDMGFLPQIARIIEVLPKNRQTLMFTATMPKQVEELVRGHMRSPVRIQIGTTAPPARAEQKLYRVRESDKTPLLMQLLGKSKGRVLVFARTKRKVDRVARTVARRHAAARIHGDREQSQRDAALSGFRDGTHRVLIATDVAARGLHVEEIEHVINYDFPQTAEDYIHRIGRTARVAASGLASSFVSSEDRSCLAQLEKMLSEKLPVAVIGNADADEPPHTSRSKRQRRPRGKRRRGPRRSGRRAPARSA